MKHTWLICAAVFFHLGCEASETVPTPAGNSAGGDSGDAGVDGNSVDTGVDGNLVDTGVDRNLVDTGVDGDRLPNTYNPPPMTRARAWIRENPMFVTGLVVSMGSPPVSVINEYYDDFNANATHLHNDSMPNEVQGWGAAGRNDFRFLSWLTNAGTSTANGQLLGGMSPSHPGRIGYQIGDEPGILCQDDGLACALDDLIAMSEGIDAVRAVDPDALLFVNFYNHDELVALLDYYGQNVDGDIISYDRYALGHGAYDTLETIRAAGLQFDKPYWRYLEAFNYENRNDQYSESDLRWSAMAGLLYGFTGHTWFLYTIRPNNQVNPALYEYEGSFAAPKTPLWGWAAQINTELRNLGRSVTQLISTDVRYLPSISLAKPARVRLWEPGAGGDPYLSVLRPANQLARFDISIGYFKDDWQDIYFMVQNVSHTSGDFPVSLGGTNTVHMEFDFSSAPSYVQRGHLLSLNELTGAVEARPLTDLGNRRASLDVTLSPGGVSLLKYDTTRDFALQ